MTMLRSKNFECPHIAGQARLHFAAPTSETLPCTTLMKERNSRAETSLITHTMPRHRRNTSNRQTQRHLIAHERPTEVSRHSFASAHTRMCTCIFAGLLPPIISAHAGTAAALTRIDRSLQATFRWSSRSRRTHSFRSRQRRCLSE